VLVELAPELSLASPHATRLAAREALEDLKPERLRALSEPAERAALAHALDGAIGKLRRSGALPSHLRSTGSPQGALLADVMERVDEILAGARQLDARGASLVLARRLRSRGGEAREVVGQRGSRSAAKGSGRGAGSAAPRPLGRSLATSAPAGTVKGMAAWEGDDLALLEALHARMRLEGGGRGVTLVLPRLGEGEDAMSPVADALEKRWGALTDSPEIEWQTAGSAAPIEVIRARTAEAEARAAASACLTALSKGTPPERIAILVPELSEASMEPLRAALADARVPFCEPGGRPIAASPEARAALLFLDLAEGPVTREKVMDLLRAPGLSAAWLAEKAQERQGRAAALAQKLREVPVEVDRTGRLLVEGLTAVIASAVEDAWMPQGLERLLASARWLSEGGTWSETARRFGLLVDRVGLGKAPARDLAAALRAEGRDGGGGLALRAVAEGALSVRRLVELAGAIGREAAALGMAGRPCTPGELLIELGRAAEAVSALPQGSSPRAAAVRVAAPGDLCGIDHDLVLVMGLSARAYGRASALDEALLDDRIRSELPAPLRPPSAREREAFRRAELAWAIAGARDIVLSFAPADEGELAEPHPLVGWAVRRGARRREEPGSRVAHRASRLNRRAAELIALARGAAPDAGLADRIQIERDRTAFFYDPKMSSGAFTGRVVVADERLRAELRARIGGASADQPIAVTHIERAAECSFAGFSRRVLRARRLEELLESADARERGTMVHRALHAAFEALREAGHGGDPLRLLGAAKEAAEEALGARLSATPLRREAITRAVADALGVVARSLEAGDPLRFEVGERRFGAGEPAPWGALELPGEGGAPSIFVDGQIDRIDRSTDGRSARVIDYKSSIPSASARKQGAFQLPLYAAVAARALGAEEVHRVYVAVKKRGEIEEWPRERSAQVITQADIEAAAKAAREVVMRLWEGDAAPRPMRVSLCDRCDVRDVCRRPAVMPVEEEDET
jgi:RecB family exonuclease